MNAPEFSASDFPDGTVCVFLDESYEPLVAAAAVSIEAADVAKIEDEIAGRHEALSGDFYLEGLESFGGFRTHGFHATGDTMEVRIEFVRYLAQAMSFKTSIVYTDGSTRPDLSPKKQLMIVFSNLLIDVLRQYRDRPHVHLVFESGDAMDKYIGRVADRAVKSLGRQGPPTSWEFRGKRDPHLLAVPDYVLHIFNTWYDTSRQDDEPQLTKADFRTREFRAILGSVSQARSLEGRRVFRRDGALHTLLDS